MLTRVTFYIALALLMVDALMEMSFVAATVAFLHNRAGGAFQIAYNGRTFSLHGKPLRELADQGHQSNGAAGTALILVGILGFITFPLLRRDNAGRPTTWSCISLPLWLVLSVLSMLLTLASLIFTFAITARHAGQTIDVAFASTLNNRPYPNQVAYPRLSWTPENWFAAVLKLNLVSSADRSLIATKHRVMMGWRWNLIPLFLLGLAVCVLGFLEARQWKQGTAASPPTQAHLSKERDMESMDEIHANTRTPILTTDSSVHRKPVPDHSAGHISNGPYSPVSPSSH